MRKIIDTIATGILAFFIFAGLLCFAQTQPSSALFYSWSSPTTTGQLGNYLVFNGVTAPRPGNYTIDWSISGTAPSACTFRIEGSSDNVNWFGLDTTSPSTTSCTTSGMESIAYKPVLYLRVNIVSWTTGGGTIIFHYTGGRS